ncbi:hypothetical protein BU25DRAFT_189652 [Macroventuria anomochaeta]|uniref:Uncharacterized protein n=1 Tax=Macroventuria anomochaeta TaxID=301207 RepID=A0ACB6SB97_9PLEO|nr:uncharacterized protein BU25DRAFT_189652 [Macroventuria anomochaeta]KAF2631486.1 hypothetical protein BU25DRAFT_189652 [Macroventuria anomochaeta]
MFHAVVWQMSLRGCLLASVLFGRVLIRPASLVGSRTLLLSSLMEQGGKSRNVDGLLRLTTCHSLEVVKAAFADISYIYQERSRYFHSTVSVC